MLSVGNNLRSIRVIRPVDDVKYGECEWEYATTECVDTDARPRRWFEIVEYTIVEK
jgi:hypothetical protein